MRLQRWSVLILCTLAFLMGCLVGKMVHLHIVNFQREVSPVHALSVLGTIFVAVFVAVLIDRNKSKDRNEKELFLRRVDAIAEIADGLHESVVTGEIKLIEATSKIKRIKSSIRCIFTALKTANLSIKTKDFEMLQIAKELNFLMTYTPPKGKAKTTDTPIQVTKSVCRYSATRTTEIEAEVERLKNCLFGIQIEVNGSYPLS